MSAIVVRRGLSTNAPPRAVARRTWLSVLASPATAVICLAVAGFLLRLDAGRGDLWLDELWSLDLVSRLRWPVDVFWAVPHDNNHPLNSFWMALVGPDRSPLLYRAPALLFGTATIAAAARFGWRTSPASGVAAAALTAFSYPFVLYGSEARGYAGLILATILAFDLWCRIMDRRDRGATLLHLRGRRWMLAAVVLFGAASHFTMLGTVAILGAATILRRWRSLGLAGSFDEAVSLFRPVFLLLTPLVLCVAGGALAHGGFAIGDVTPFAARAFADGYGGLLAAMLGLRALASGPWSLLAAALLLATGFTLRLIDRQALALALAAFVLLPMALVAGHVGNTGYPRYFLTAGVLLPLLTAEAAGRIWTLGPRTRPSAILLVLLIIMGQWPDLRLLLQAHRGAPAAAMALAEPGDAIRIGGDRPFAATTVATHFAAVGRHTLSTTGQPLPCDLPPKWLFYDSDPDAQVAQRVLEGGRSCPTAYVLVRSFPTTAWSGRIQSIYRRDP